MTTAIAKFRAFAALLQIDQGKAEFDSLRAFFEEDAWNHLTNEAEECGLEPRKVIEGFVFLEAAPYLMNAAETAEERDEMAAGIADRIAEFTAMHLMQVRKALAA
jgi:hypothetical protein